MVAKYWVAKHVADPFRAEPRNVGVFVEASGEYAARFLGERGDLSVDGRPLRRHFTYPNIYRQWIEFWRAELGAKNMDEIITSATPSFFVVPGGEVGDTDQDDAAAICDFLFSLLVGDGGAVEAFELNAEVEEQAESERLPKLKNEVIDAFAELSIVDGMAGYVPHPVLIDHTVQGRITSHTPSFVQRNGHLLIYEVVDFTQRKKTVTERAGWTAYMFSDVHERDVNAEAYSIIRPSEGDDSLGYARAMLSAESKMINWADEAERGRFLDSRRLLALSGN